MFYSIYKKSFAWNRELVLSKIQTNDIQYHLHTKYTFCTYKYTTKYQLYHIFCKTCFIYFLKYSTYFVHTNTQVSTSAHHTHTYIDWLSQSLILIYLWTHTHKHTHKNAHTMLYLDVFMTQIHIVTSPQSAI